MFGTNYRPIGFQQLTATSTTDTKGLTIPTGTRALMISVETTDARIDFNGNTPSSTKGHVFKAGVTPALLPIGVAVAPTIQFVSTAAANSVVDVTYFE